MMWFTHEEKVRRFVGLLEKPTVPFLDRKISGAVYSKSQAELLRDNIICHASGLNKYKY